MISLDMVVPAIDEELLSDYKPQSVGHALPRLQNQISIRLPHHDEIEICSSIDVLADVPSILG